MMIASIAQQGVARLVFIPRILCSLKRLQGKKMMMMKMMKVMTTNVRIHGEWQLVFAQINITCLRFILIAVFLG